MKTEDLKNLGILAALAGGAVLAYRFYSDAKGALTTAGEAIGSGLFDFFHPDQLGETTFYIVTFPDGVKHSVPSRSVDANGLFTNKNLAPNYAGDGKRYRILVATNGTRTAFPV